MYLVYSYTFGRGSVGKFITVYIIHGDFFGLAGAAEGDYQHRRRVAGKRDHSPPAACCQFDMLASLIGKTTAVGRRISAGDPSTSDGSSLGWFYCC